MHLLTENGVAMQGISMDGIDLYLQDKWHGGAV